MKRIPKPRLMAKAEARIIDGAVVATLPIKVVSGMNMREHHQVRAKRIKRERDITTTMLRYALRGAGLADGTGCFRVTFTRIAPGKLDSDNLVSGMKGPRDSVADLLGINDRSDRIAWVVQQLRAAYYGLEVTIEPLEAGAASPSLLVT